ncbi:MAG: hypothetical protein K8R58_01480, partial [Bacteroidales bacterium]|nr:hypothetical protein [Bacteroidales bacterium]
MKKLSQYFAVVFLLFSVLLSNVNGQNTFKSEDDLKKKAKKLFNIENFQEALPLYSQLLSVYPKEPLFNYRYGVCLMCCDRRDNTKFIKYLKFASDNSCEEKELYYYFGLAYHLNLNFLEAINAYEKYKAKGKVNKSFDIDRKIETCKNGISLLNNNIIKEIIEKNEVNKENFYRSYSINNFGGKFLIKPDNFQSKIDQKKQETSIVFISDNKQVIYFSSYGEDSENNKDIYRSFKLPNGEWDESEKLDKIINTSYDEDYPVMLPDGKILLFCSKGHNTMGGYDIFLSVLNTVENKWSKPVNLDSEINSPFDDILFIVDPSHEYAYFSSDRNSVNEFITVYKVKLTDEPFVQKDLALVQKQDNISTSQDITKKNIAKADLIIIADNEQVIKPEISSGDDIKPSEIAEKKLKERQEAKQMVDSAFIQADILKQLLKDLESKKDEINSIGNRKKILAYNKHKQFEDSFMIAVNLTDENIKQKEISKANNIKAEAEKLETEAKYAFQIGEQLTKQINIKKNETERIKNYAGNIQIIAATCSVDSTIILYNLILDEIKTADTLKDYTMEISLFEEDVFTYKENGATEQIASKDIKKQSEKIITPEVIVNEGQVKSQLITKDTISEDEKNKLIADVNKNIDLIKNEYNEVKKRSDIALVICEEKNKSFYKKLYESTELILEENAEFSEEQKQIQNQLIKLAREAIVAYNIFYLIEPILEQKQNDNNFAIQTEKLLNSGMYKQVKEKYNELEKIAKEQKYQQDISVLVLSEIPKLNPTKKKQADRSLEIAEKNKEEYTELTEDANKIRAKADKKKNPKKKKKLLREVKQLEARANQKQILYQKNYQKGTQMLNEYYSVKTQNEITNEILNMTENDSLALSQEIDIALIDKGKLYNEINEYRDNDIFIENSVYFETKTVSIIENYKTKKEISVLDAEAAYAKAAFMQKSNKLINTEIELLKQKSTFTNDRTEKEKLQEKINELQELSDSINVHLKEIFAIAKQLKEIDDTPDYFETPPDNELTFTKVLEQHLTEKLNEIDQLRNEVDSIEDINKKKELNDIIDKKVKNAQLLQLEVFDAFGIANRNDYLVNNIKIEQLKIQDKDIDDLMQAESYIEEADYLFNQAIESRIKANGDLSYESKKYLFEDAVTFELAAIEQQKKALNIYMNENPDAVTIAQRLDNNIYT